MAEALILIDMQRGFLEGRAAVPNPERLIKNLARLLSVARAASALVIHLQNDGPPGQPDEPQSWGWQLSLYPDSATTR